MTDGVTVGVFVFVIDDVKDGVGVVVWVAVSVFVLDELPESVGKFDNEFINEFDIFAEYESIGVRVVFELDDDVYDVEYVKLELTEYRLLNEFVPFDVWDGDRVELCSWDTLILLVKVCSELGLLYTVCV